MKITVEEDKCCAGGQCVLAAPEVFDQRDEDGIVVVLDDTPGPAQYDAVREAAQICPAACIHVHED
ncbi:ferredoxin [Streptomyces sp. KL116D]|uniref:ferredoxin n=1 Tax=Streptomyces sp. KL116D TaxID=3045152 RepID=UPI0035569CA9